MKNQQIYDELLGRINILYPDGVPNNLSVWDIIVSALTMGDTDKQLYVSTLGDLEIIKLVAHGNSILSVKAKLGHSTSNDILAVCKRWGLTPPRETLDFDPIVFFAQYSDPRELEESMNDFSTLELNRNDVENIVHNIDVYYGVIEFLKECYD